MAMSSKGVMQRQEMSVDQQLLAGMVAGAVGLKMLTDGDTSQLIQVWWRETMYHPKCISGALDIRFIHYKHYQMLV